MATEIVRRNIIVEYVSKQKKFEDDQKKLGKSTINLTKIFNQAKGALLGFATAGAIFQTFKQAVRTINEFQVSLKELQSLTGLTEKEVAALGDVAIDISTKFGTSAKEIVDGFAKVGSAAPQLLGNQDALAEVTKQADILSKAAGISLDEAIDAVTKTMNQYGLEAHQASELTDILATSQQKGTARITDLTLSLKNVGSAANAMGLSVEETNVHLQALAKGGLTGAEAGIKLRNIYTRLANTGREELNPATQDFADILDTLAKEGYDDVTKASKLFGAQNFTAAQTLIAQRKTVKDLSGSLNEVGNAMEQAGINTDTNAAAVERAGAAWNALVLSIDKGDGVISRAFSRLVNNFTQTIEGLRGINDGLLEFSDRGVLGLLNPLERLSASIKQVDSEIAKLGDDIENEEGLKLQIKRIKLLEDQSRLLLSQAKDEKTRKRDQAILTGILRERTFLEEQLRFITEENVEALSDLNSEEAVRVETLKSLKKALKEAKEERDGINIADKSALRANEQIIVALTKRIKALDITAESTKNLAEEQKKATRELETLQIALIRGESDRNIAALQQQNKIALEDFKGTEEQKAQFALLSNQKLRNDINAIREQQLKDSLQFEQDARDFIAEDNKKREQDLIDQDNRESDLRELGFQKERIEVQKKLKDRVISEEEAARQISLIELEALKARLLNLSLSEAERIDIKEQIINAEIALEKDLTEKTKEEQQERLKLAGEAINQIAGILNQVFEAEQARIEKSISLQEERVEKAREIADRGNAELLQLEEERLTKLNQQREKAARKQRAVQAAQIAANAALAVSNTITTITSGGVQGGIFGIIATGISLAATVASAVIAVRNALSDVPAFAEGVDQFSGEGTAKSDSNLIRISHGERITDAETTSKLMKMGVTNDNVVALAGAGIQAISSPSYSPSAISSGTPSSSSGKEYSELKEEIKKNTKAIQNLGIKSTIDHKGFTSEISKRNKLKERRNKML